MHRRVEAYVDTEALLSGSFTGRIVVEMAMMRGRVERFDGKTHVRIISDCSSQ